MWFSPLKGAHLTLGQLDKTLPVEMDYTTSTSSTDKINTKIERGSFVYVRATTNTGSACDPSFSLYTSAEAAKPNAVPYIALMSVYDFQAGMAGNVGQAPEAAGIDKGTLVSGDEKTFLDPHTTAGAQAFTGPRITAISVVQPAEYQTTAFDLTKDYYVGQPLTINNDGKLTPFVTGKNIVGYVTAVPKKRWINDLGASSVGARISGGNAKVLEFSTAWIPVAATSAGTVPPGESDTVKPLNAGKPQVAPAAAPADAKPVTPAK